MEWTEIMNSAIASGVTMSEVSKEMGMNNSSLNRILNGKQEPKDKDAFMAAFKSAVKEVLKRRARVWLDLSCDL